MDNESSRRCMPEIYETLSYGHRISFEIGINRLSLVLCKRTLRTYNIDCKKYPSTWIFSFITRPASADGIVSIPITLKREDYSVFVADASINVSLCNARGDILLEYERHFNNSLMGLNDTLIGDIRGSLQTSEQIESYNDMVKIRGNIEIRNCHGYDLEKEEN